jgi:carboxylesterase
MGGLEELVHTKPQGTDRSLFFPGNGIGVLLIHGLGGTPLELKSIARGLSAGGFTVACCQLAGHCGTEADLRATNWHDWFNSVEAALSALEKRCTTVVVGGLSMGAILALRVAAVHPKRVHGLALFAPTLWYDGWSIPWYGFLLRMFIGTWAGRRYRFVEREPYGIKDERIRAFIAGAMFSGNSEIAGCSHTPSQSIRELLRLVNVVKNDLPSITTPSLVVQAREDDISALSNAIYLQRRLGGLVECLVLDDSYHLVTIDRQRDIVVERSRDFVSFVARTVGHVEAFEARPRLAVQG